MIRIAIQSKGRLNEQSVELLQDAGLNVNDLKRKFLDRVDNFPIEILYLRDDDIPEVVADGSADIGIVGYNEVAETEAAVSIAATVLTTEAVVYDKKEDKPMMPQGGGMEGMY